jgi:type II pantothenate kinase
MVRQPGELIIGIDRGASFTDFGVVQKNRLIHSECLETRDWKHIERMYGRLAARYPTPHVVFTGSAADMPERIRREAVDIPEIDAIGLGGAVAAGRKECVVVSMGTGTAVVHVAPSGCRHVGGTGMGGGTIRGLASLICGTDDPLEIESMAMKGRAKQVNLTISDLGYEAISFLGADMTASNFAALRSPSKEDLAAAILSLAGETVGIVASICAREARCSQAIVVVGKVAANAFIRQTLELVGRLYRTSFLFPDHPGFATVFGAAVKYRLDRQKSS